MGKKLPPPDLEFREESLPRDMTHWRAAFDSRFLRHFALCGRPRIVTIVDVRVSKSESKKAKESDSKLLIKLAEFEKPWRANVTNCDIIEMLYGPDPHAWIGKRIELYPTKTRFGGDMVDCIRVKPEAPPDGKRTEAPKHRQEVAAYLHEMKEATDLQQCIPIADRIAEDNTLSADETDKLLKALTKRREQLGAAMPGAV